MATGAAVDDAAIVMEGRLRKCSRHLKVWRERHCVLTDKFLCTFKSQDCRGKPTEVILLRELEGVVRKPGAFRLDTLERHYYFAADSSTDVELWIRAIRLFTSPQASAVPAPAAPRRSPPPALIADRCTPGPPAEQALRFAREEPDPCSICLDQEATRRLVPCGHRVCCAGCAPLVAAMRPHVCPLCRTPFHELVVVVRRPV